MLLLRGVDAKLIHNNAMGPKVGGDAHQFDPTTVYIEYLKTQSYGLKTQAMVGILQIVICI